MPWKSVKPVVEVTPGTAVITHKEHFTWVASGVEVSPVVTFLSEASKVSKIPFSLHENLTPGSLTQGVSMISKV